MAQYFKAPWGLKLKLATGFFMLLILFAFLGTGAPGGYVGLGIGLVCAVFAVRGYSVVNGQLLIHRLGWVSRFDLSKLHGAEFAPGATLGSIRIFGIGGLFGFIGHFRNPILGSYRAYATDAANAVVLDFGSEKVVVTPESPAKFVVAVRGQIAP